MQSEVSEAQKALAMLRNVPSYHLPSYKIVHGSWNKPARRPAEMATADSPKDGEPSTVFGML